MNLFWTYAARMLQFRKQIVIAVVAAIFDAISAFAGFSVVMLIINQLFGKDDTTIHKLLSQKLQDISNQDWMGFIHIGDLTPLADYIPTDPFTGLAYVFGFIMILSIFGASMRYVFQATVLTISFRTVMILRKEAFQRLLHAPYEILLEQGSIDFMSRITRDTNQLARGFNTIMGRAAREALLSIVFLTLAFVVNWKLTLLFLLAAPPMAFVIRKLSKRIRRASKKAMSAYGGMLGAVSESTQAIQVVKVHNAEGYERRRFNVINKQVFRQEMKARAARVLASPLTELIAIAGMMGVVLVAAYQVYYQNTNPTDMLKVLMSLGLAGATAKPLAKLNNDLQEAAAAAERVDELLKLPIEKNTREIYKHLNDHLPPHLESIEFKDVSYTYPRADQPAIRHLDLQVKFGQNIAIVGPNGSGKSTLLNLLPRLGDAQKGQVLIDGHDITTISIRSLRKQIAVVTQQTFLFEGTIADNIAYGRRHTSREDIIAAATAARADEFISVLDNGYDTFLGEGGSGLSGGQKQRICIARAILRNPRILILDEATSQIDADSEYKINQAMAEFRKGRTTFVIAHRLSTVIDADQIIVMVDGEISDIGSHNELLERSTTYQTLTHTQLQPYEDLD
ncbi:Lipid A export ATP-binding/permease protein MsbA [Poriferisphaera corsica]|uniref:Lipid A export ATP-binding/permease protein MsbA n=1 Tax=Poriferisphaera corsica TaxID=2528020 RepID=A0A517YV67_9BACT|nr:ABC transporter ATP-binding protein [Poriferisphaera corsica]QDU34117.1 Lipid A export ATP-binding/permease protein MsbA [Poriferisphaera corsica]